MANGKQLQKQWNKVYDKFTGKRLSVWREKPTAFFINRIPFLKKHGPGHHRQKRHWRHSYFVLAQKV